MIKLWNAVTGGWIVYALLAAMVVGAFGYTYHLGGKHTAAEWQVKYTTLERNYATAALAEGTRQATANQAAKQAEAIRIAIIAAQSAALQDLQRKLDDEQDNDPTSSTDCINDAGRVRLNKID